MDSRHAGKMMDAFYKGKRIYDQLPALPEGVIPSYVHILDAVYELSAAGKPARVSDIARLRSLPVPGVTRTLKEMELEGLVRKESDKSDRRVVRICLTSKGLGIREKYVGEYFSQLTKKFPGVSDDEIDEMVGIINKIGKVYDL